MDFIAQVIIPNTCFELTAPGNTNVTLPSMVMWNDDDAITHDPLRMRITNLRTFPDLTELKLRL
jgi:hypothetical protein